MNIPPKTEHEIQTEFISWCRFPGTLKKHPELELIYANINGARVAWKQANKLKEEGMTAGIPDLFLPVARGGYHGLYLEFKRSAKEKLSQAQIDWKSKLGLQGYLVLVVSSSLTAEEIVLKYLRGWYGRD